MAKTGNRWLFWLCTSRLCFALINTTYAALIPVLRIEWSMSATQAGLIQSAWHGGYVLSLITASGLSGRFGAKRTFLAMGYAACGGVLLFALLADSFATALILHGLAGLCAGGSYVPGLALIGENTPSSQRGRAMGLYIAAASMGYALSILGANALAASIGTRAGLLLGAAGCLLGQAIALGALRNTANLVVHKNDSASAVESLLWLWRHKPARLVILTYGFHAWELLGMWAWLPAYLNHALKQQRPTGAAAYAASAVVLAALTHATSSAGSMIGGALSDRWGRSTVILALSLTSIACSALIGWIAWAPIWLVAFVAVLLNTAAIADSGIYSAALTEWVPARHLSAAFSVRSTIGFGMGALSPWLMGFVLDANAAPDGTPDNSAWGLAWTALAVVGMAGPLLGIRLRQLQPASQRIAQPRASEGTAPPAPDHRRAPGL
jgi:MFS family permease